MYSVYYRLCVVQNFTRLDLCLKGDHKIKVVGGGKKMEKNVISCFCE